MQNNIPMNFSKCIFIILFLNFSWCFSQTKIKSFVFDYSVEYNVSGLTNSKLKKETYYFNSEDTSFLARIENGNINIFCNDTIYIGKINSKGDTDIFDLKIFKSNNGSNNYTLDSIKHQNNENIDVSGFMSNSYSSNLKIDKDSYPLTIYMSENIPIDINYYVKNFPLINNIELKKTIPEGIPSRITIFNKNILDIISINKIDKTISFNLYRHYDSVIHEEEAYDNMYKYPPRR